MRRKVKMTEGQWQQWFEAVWADREERIYAAQFGELGEGIYPLDPTVFQHSFGCDEIDPRWLTIGVFESPPNQGRTSWVYVSSGLSNAWDADGPQPGESSGLGMEFVMECGKRAPWALALVRTLTAYQVLLAAGQFGERPLLGAWGRMQPGGPIDGKKSKLDTLLFAPSTRHGGAQELSSGKFEFLQILGTSKAELDWGKTHGFEKLHERLLALDLAPVVDAGRASIE